MKKINKERVVLVGHSMGGKVAMTFACKWPKKVAGLVSMDQPPINRNPYPKMNSYSKGMLR